MPLPIRWCMRRWWWCFLFPCSGLGTVGMLVLVFFCWSPYRDSRSSSILFLFFSSSLLLSVFFSELIRYEFCKILDGTEEGLQCFGVCGVFQFVYCVGFLFVSSDSVSWECVRVISFRFGRILISFCLLCIFHFLVLLVSKIIFGYVLLLFPGLRWWCRLAKRVFGVRVVCLFVLRNLLVCRLDRRNFSRIGSSLSFFRLSWRHCSVYWFPGLVSFVRMHNQGLSRRSRLGRGRFLIIRWIFGLIVVPC